MTDSPASPAIIPEQECLVRVRRNDWVLGLNQISRSYVEMFRKAHSHVVVLSAYFMPGPILRKQMARAARRRVNIRIIVGAVSDIKIARLAEQYMYRWLFRNGIEVYEYQGTVLHGKMAAYDGIWMTNGSYNVNRISAYASVELNMDVRNNEFAAPSNQIWKRSSATIVSGSIPRAIFTTTTGASVSANGPLTRPSVSSFFSSPFISNRKKNPNTVDLRARSTAPHSLPRPKPRQNRPL